MPADIVHGVLIVTLYLSGMAGFLLLMAWLEPHRPKHSHRHVHPRRVATRYERSSSPD